MERTRTDLGVIRLHDDTTLLSPILLETQDDFLERKSVFLHALDPLDSRSVHTVCYGSPSTERMRPVQGNLLECCAIFTGCQSG